MGIWKRRERELERRLAALRQQPDDELVLRLSNRVLRHTAPSARSSRMKVGLALGLSALGLIVFSVFGGLGYASSAAQKATKVVKVVKVSSSTSSVKVVKSTATTKSVKTYGTGSSGSGGGSSTPSYTICHWTSSTSPLQSLNVSRSQLVTYRSHDGDLVTAPTGGICPSPGTDSGGGKVDICVWSAADKDYSPLTITDDKLATYRAQSGNIIPKPDSGCPRAETGNGGGKSQICKWNGYNKAYTLLSVTNAELATYKTQTGHVIPAPTTGCPSYGSGNGGAPSGKTRICHWASSNTWQQLDIATSAVAAHKGHGGDMVPMPTGGCPKPGDNGGGTTWVCHWDGHSDSEPYSELEVANRNVATYKSTKGDIVPRPSSGCPHPGKDDEGTTWICHWDKHSSSSPYTEMEVGNKDLDSYKSHPGEIVPRPKGGCPHPGDDPGDDDHGGGGGGGGGGSGCTDTSHGAGNSQYGGCTPICHKTASASNPYVLLFVPTSALPAHASHGDIIPAPAKGCPGGGGGGGGGGCDSSSSYSSSSSSSDDSSHGGSSHSGGDDNSGGSGNGCGGGGGDDSSHCNSGRGNGSEGDSSQLLYPGTDKGPGTKPTTDCDPGNSGSNDHGGD